MAGRHRDAVERYLESCEGDPITVETVRGLADLWDSIEISGKNIGQVPQLAAVLMQAAEKLSVPHLDLLASLEAELRSP
tara:strand:+ start:154 stop:390 length:237 start_codon:yes stop_codon:yes gene_type:complete